MRTLYTLLLLAACVTGTGISASAQCTVAPCNGYRTQTQGGWGSNPKGNNPGSYLHNRFATAFPAPGYLTVGGGCANGFTIKLTSAAAVTAFLPQGGTPKALTASLVNPTKSSYGNVFAGQVVALKISLTFDQADPNFGSAAGNLKNLVVASGTFQGWSVQQVFDEASKKLGGCASPYSFSQLNDAVSKINENYVDGVTSGNYLICPITATAVASQPNCPGDFGSIAVSVLDASAPLSFSWNDGSTVQNRSGLPAGSYCVTVTDCAGRTASACAVVNAAPAPIAIDTLVYREMCAVNPCGNAVDISVSGGTPGYSFAWSNASTTQDLSSLCAGFYQVTVTDAHSCTAVSEAVFVSCIPTACDTLKTITQGGWGAEPHGGNNGVYLHSHFAGAFFTGSVSIGCDDGNKLTFTSAQAVTDFLPSGGTPRTLEFSAANPTGYGNTLAGQLLAATLNVTFDYMDAGFSASDNNLGDYYFVDGPFWNMSVNQVIWEANQAIGGCGSAFTHAELNEALSHVNENYHEGTADLGYLTCALMGENLRKEQTQATIPAGLEINMYPNPTSGTFAMNVGNTHQGTLTLKLVDMIGRTVMTAAYEVSAGSNTINVTLPNIADGCYNVMVINGSEISVKTIMVKR